MKRVLNLFVVIMIVSLVFTGCTSKDKDVKNSVQSELTISAASSLKESLDEIVLEYEKENSNVKLLFNFGASGTLQKQIEEGANVDVFISAAEKQMNILQEKNLLEKDSRYYLLKNRLVLISNKENNQIFDRENSKLKLAIGSLGVVPAGDYAKEVLDNMNIFEKLKNNIVYAKDVKQVLSYVESNNVDFGIVYKSDAISSSKCKILETYYENLHSKIIYPCAILAKSAQKDEAKKFLEYLKGDYAKKVFERYGFECVNK